MKHITYPVSVDHLYDNYPDQLLNSDLLVHLLCTLSVHFKKGFSNLKLVFTSEDLEKYNNFMFSDVVEIKMEEYLSNLFSKSNLVLPTDSIRVKFINLKYNNHVFQLITEQLGDYKEFLSIQMIPEDINDMPLELGYAIHYFTEVFNLPLNSLILDLTLDYSIEITIKSGMFVFSDKCYEFIADERISLERNETAIELFKLIQQTLNTPVNIIAQSLKDIDLLKSEIHINTDFCYYNEQYYLSDLPKKIYDIHDIHDIVDKRVENIFLKFYFNQFLKGRS